MHQPSPIITLYGLEIQPPYDFHSMAERGSSEKLTITEALSYIMRVRERFQENREKFEAFLRVIQDFKAQRVDTSELFATIMDMFQDHPDLIMGFATFLPAKPLEDDQHPPPQNK